jgi:hypothetical protein
MRRNLFSLPDMRGTATDVPAYTIKACRGSGGKAPLILNLHTRWVGQPHALAALAPRKNSGAHCIGACMDPRAWTGLGKRGRNSGAGIRTLDSSGCTLVTISTKPWQV